MNTVSTFKYGKITLNRQDDLFFLAYVLLFTNQMFRTYTHLYELFGSASAYIENILYICFIAVCIISFILRRRYKRSELIFIAVMLAAGASTYYFSGGHDFFDFTLLVCIAKGVDFNKFVKRTVIFLGIFLVVIMGLSLVGLISSKVSERADTSLVRNSLGFTHPNVLGMLIFSFIAGIILILRERMKLIHYLILIGVILFCFFTTRSYSSVFCSSLLLFVVFLYNAFFHQRLSARQIKRIILAVIVLSLVAVGIFVWYFWAHPELLTFETLAKRITYAQKYLNAYGVNWFGHDILTGMRVALPGYSAGKSYLDNGEVWYLVRYGIIGFVFFFFIYIRMISRTISNREFIFCIVAVVFLVYSFTENTALRISFNCMIPYSCILLYDGHRIFARRKRSQNLV